ncbi:MAG: hypothetical protein KKB20_08020 [Proteobacteria bacterium]|nr:hypothetical protein [Pseudomonadota bacterium]
MPLDSELRPSEAAGGLDKRKRLLFFLIYLVLVALFVELGLQFFYFATTGAPLWRRVAQNIYVQDDLLGWKVEPDLDFMHRTTEFSVRYRTNEQGFRSPGTGGEFKPDKDPSTYRILLMGPSFAFGWAANFPDCFAARLQAFLQAGGFADGKRIEIVNAGVPSMPPANFLHWYDKRGRTFKPDLVIQMLYGSMAETSRVNYAYRVDRNGYLVSKDAPWSMRVKAGLKNLAAVYYTFTLYQRIAARFQERSRPRDLAGAGRVMRTGLRFGVDSPAVRDALDLYDGFKRTVESSGARLLFVYFPLGYCVHPEDVVRWRHLGDVDPEGQNAFDRVFCEYLNSEMNIPCLNATPDLIRAAGQGRRLYYFIDVHWTPLGNRVVARAVADYLLSRP